MYGYSKEMLAIVRIEKFDSISGCAYVDYMRDSMVLRIERTFP